MRYHRSFARLALSALSAALTALIVVGCSDDGGLGQRYKVSGNVTYKNAPVEKGVINFVPLEATGRGAGGRIVGGSYTLTTLNEGDGALPGKYKVTVDTREIDNAATKSAAEAEAAKKGMTVKLSMVPPEFQAKALKDAKGTIPGKYQIPSTSDVEVEVKAQSNSLDIELKD